MEVSGTSFHMCFFYNAIYIKGFISGWSDYGRGSRIVGEAGGEEGRQPDGQRPGRPSRAVQQFERENTGSSRARIEMP